MQVKVLIAMFLALIIVVFALQNPGTVTIRFLQWQTGEISLLIVIFGSALLGAVIMSLFSTAGQWALRRELRQKETELAELRAQQDREERPAPHESSQV